MNRGHFRRAASSTGVCRADEIVARLTTWQHLHPHQPLCEVLQKIKDELDCSGKTVDRAVRWLELEVNEPIGRLRRSELIQLGRSLGRFRQQPESLDQSVSRLAD